jgi:hypothetical protein
VSWCDLVLVNLVPLLLLDENDKGISFNDTYRLAFGINNWETVVLRVSELKVNSLEFLNKVETDDRSSHYLHGCEISILLGD